MVEIDEGPYQYRIVNGEHRYHACRVAGMKLIPSVLLTDEKWKDEDLQKFVTVRNNILRGKISPEKFVRLYQDLAKKYKPESLRELFKFTDEDEWKRLTVSMRDSLKKMGLPQELIDKFSANVKEMKSIDDLSIILNSIFTEYGRDSKLNFMCFSWAGKEILYVMANDKVFKKVKEFVKWVREEEIDINGPLLEIFTEAMKDRMLDKVNK